MQRRIDLRAFVGGVPDVPAALQSVAAEFHVEVRDLRCQRNGPAGRQLKGSRRGATDAQPDVIDAQQVLIEIRRHACIEQDFDGRTVAGSRDDDAGRQRDHASVDVQIAGDEFFEQHFADHRTRAVDGNRADVTKHQLTDLEGHGHAEAVRRRLRRTSLTHLAARCVIGIELRIAQLARVHGRGPGSRLVGGNGRDRDTFEAQAFDFYTAAEQRQQGNTGGEGLCLQRSALVRQYRANLAHGQSKRGEQAERRVAFHAQLDAATVF